MSVPGPSIFTVPAEAPLEMTPLCVTVMPVAGVKVGSPATVIAFVYVPLAV